MILFALAMVQASPPTDIVVQAQRLNEAAKLCAAQGCTPLRDAQISIALAEQAFRAGDYRKAKGTLADALSRNKKHAATDPKPVAALYEAYATVNAHFGAMDLYRQAVAGQVRTVRIYLPESDPAAMTAAFALGDMWIKLGNYNKADTAFHSAERRALSVGQTRTAALLTMRRIWVAAAQDDRAQADRLLAELKARPAAQDPAMQVALRVVQLRMAAKRADDGQVDRLVADIGHQTTARPVLLWSPPFEPTGQEGAAENARKFGDPEPTPIGPGFIQWADIGFWIKPDGHVNEVDILRGSQSRTWTAPVVRQVEGRRYTGTPDDTGPGTYRIERFTQRATIIVPIGSILRQRVGPTGIETLDLTDPGAKVTAVR